MKHNNMSRGRGHGYQNYSSSGPLMTDHLQGLQVRNLDRELEILRRKREMIQREQQMLNLESDLDRKRQYEQSNRNVSNMYGNDWQPPPKRPNAPRQANPWTNAPQGGGGRNVSNSVPRNYIPSLLSKKIDPPMAPISMKPIVHPILKNSVAQRLFTPMNVRKDFRLNQVTKKKANDPPNNLNSYPVKERKDLISKATGSQLPKNKINKSLDPETMILREDQKPNKQVTGRLELALGSIVKEMRSSNSDNDAFKTSMTNPAHWRTMKQAVRERLRAIMLNQTVGSVVDIVNKYREKFSKETDSDLIELVINSEHPNVTVVETESPEEFFKKNITSILEKKIQEMSSNLLKMYVHRKNVNRKNTLAKVTEDADIKLDESEKELNDEVAAKVLRGLTGKYVTIEERNVLTNYYTGLIEGILEEKIPEYLPKCTEQFLKIFDIDHQFKTVKFMAAKQIKNETKTSKSDSKDQNETDTEISEKNETEEKEDSGNNEILDKVVTENKQIEEEMLIDNNKIKKEAVNNNDETEKEAVDKNKDKGIINENNVMKKEPVTPIKDNQIKELTVNKSGTEMTCEAKKNNETTPATPIPATTGEKLLSTPTPATLKSIKTQDSETIKPTTPIAKKLESSSTNLISPVTVSTPSSKELPYYVKLIGRPKLPNRAAICDFLNNYQPSSIKKHKSIGNLLVVGFVNHEDYKNILAANETVIGDTTIIIKSSEKVTPGNDTEFNTTKKDTQKETDPNNDAQKEIKGDDKTVKKLDDGNAIGKDNKDAENQDVKDLIGKELDDQITDLLSTIREADENIDNSNNAPSLEPIKEDEVKNGETQESGKADKISKANVKEGGRATPVRSSSRLGNITPSTIRTRRASRLMQE